MADEHGLHFDTVQMPLNAFDATYRSFQQYVLPEALRRGMGVIGMKSLGGGGEPIQQGAVTVTGGPALRHEPAGVGHGQRHRLDAGAAPKSRHRQGLPADDDRMK